jgi:hypothetical protein
MKNRTVFHLEIKETGQLFYGGSLKAVYEAAAAKADLGNALKTIYNHDFKEPFDNGVVLIRKGELLSSKHSK